MEKKNVIKLFMIMPGVGKSIAEDLWNLGYRTLEEIKPLESEFLYESSCNYQGIRIDRCLLYVYKCIHYYLNNEIHEPELLKWWNWSDFNLKKNNLTK